MSIGHSLKSSLLEESGNIVPWQYRAQPALVSTVAAIVGGLLTIGLLFVVRRLTGAFTADLSPDAMLLFALVSASVLTYTRIAWRRNFPIETAADLSLADKLLGYGSSTALVLLAVGCCFPGNRTTEWLIWLPILVADQMWRQTFFDAGDPGSTIETPAGDFYDIGTEPTLNFSATAPEIIGASQRMSPQYDGPMQDDIVQQLYRLREEEGQEVIYGTVRADFVAGQRTAVVHVGFCPPLDYLPEIEAEALPGIASAQIKVVQALAHGARLDVRLTRIPAADCQLWIDLAARPVGSSTQAMSA